MLWRAVRALSEMERHVTDEVSMDAEQMSESSRSTSGPCSKGASPLSITKSEMPSDQ